MDYEPQIKLKGAFQPRSSNDRKESPRVAVLRDLRWTFPRWSLGNLSGIFHAKAFTLSVSSTAELGKMTGYPTKCGSLNTNTELNSQPFDTKTKTQASV